MHGRWCRDLSRHVAADHGLSRLFDIGDVLGNRGRGDQVFLAIGDFDAAGIEVALRDTLKKAVSATVGRINLLIFHGLESAARNFSVFP